MPLACFIFDTFPKSYFGVFQIDRRGSPLDQRLLPKIIRDRRVLAIFQITLISGMGVSDGSNKQEQTRKAPPGASSFERNEYPQI